MTSVATPPYLGQLFTVRNQVLRKTTVHDSRSLDNQTQAWFLHEQERTLCHERRKSPVVDMSEIPCHGSLTFPGKSTTFSPKIGISDTSTTGLVLILSFCVPGKTTLAFDCRVSRYHEQGLNRVFLRT